jgi:hypothetical protein
MKEEKNYSKEFLAVFDKFSYRYPKWQIWNDFLYLSAVSMANVIKTDAWEEREKRYLEIIHKYPEEYRSLFPEMFGLIMLGLESNPEQDLLGTLYHRLHLEQEQKGQFFTPYHISHFMAEVQMVDQDLESKKEQKEKDYITVSDPACGAGAMLIAFANVAREHKLNYQRDVLFVAQDIDQTAALMCYIQLSLLGCPAVVIVGDSLAKPGFHPDNEVWYTPMFYLNHHRFADFFTGAEDTENIVAEAEIVVEQKEVQKYVEEAGGQFVLPIEIAS